VYRPANKHAFATVGFPGLAGCLSGMNDQGLSVAILEVYSTKDGSPKYDPRGRPNFFTFRQVLEQCATVEEAVKLLRETPRATLKVHLAIGPARPSALPMKEIDLAPLFRGEWPAAQK